MSRSRVAAVLGLAVLLGACQVDSPSRSPVQPPQGSATLAPIDPAMTLGPPPPSPTPDLAAPPVIDAALLEYLPDSVGEAPVIEAPEEAALALSELSVASIATALHVGLALDESTGNLVTAHVVRLREGAFDDAIFREWRDSYDDGACVAAGGVEGRAETTIDERTVYVTSCATALRTYHTWIEDEDVLISASAVGGGEFGRLLMEGLRVP